MLIQLNNLHLNTIETDLQRLFTPFGEIRAIRIVRDKLSNRSRGKAYIDMPVEKQAESAIVNLHGVLLDGKSIAVTAVSGLEENEIIAASF